MDWITRVTRAVDGAVIQGRVYDWVREQGKRKWKWAGHVARRTDGRWNTMMLSWQPYGWWREQGRPSTRWQDGFQKFGKTNGFRWEEAARSKIVWDSWGKKFLNAAK